MRVTLLSELTALLLPAAARDLRERGAAGELRADDLVSISRLLEIAAELVVARDMARDGSDAAEPLDAAKRAAASDLAVIAAVERKRASRT
jgi:hypothetical protein